MSKAGPKCRSCVRLLTLGAGGCLSTAQVASNLGYPAVFGGFIGMFMGTVAGAAEYHKASK